MIQHKNNNNKYNKFLSTMQSWSIWVNL